LITIFEWGLYNIEELKRMEAEKIVKSIQAELSFFERQQIYSLSNITGPFKIDWSFLSDFAFDPGLLADLGILENVETPPDIRLGF